MIKITFAALAAVTVLAGLSTMAQAKSIKADMSPGDIAAYCANVGANTTTTTTIKLAGKSVTGSVHCTAADLKVASADSTESEVGPSEAAENGKED